MSIISPQTVRLKATAENKEAAIRLAGQLLVEAGHVTPAYVDGMLAREKTMSTYIGNGVAIPHGQFDDKANILSTGISVVQLLDGVAWQDDDEPDDEPETAYLVIGIAATNDEHVSVLTNLAEAIEEPDEATKLINSATAADIIAVLDQASDE